MMGFLASLFEKKFQFHLVKEIWVPLLRKELTALEEKGFSGEIEKFGFHIQFNLTK